MSYTITFFPKNKHPKRYSDAIVYNITVSSWGTPDETASMQYLFELMIEKKMIKESHCPR
jgi:hypothetical protein